MSIDIIAKLASLEAGLDKATRLNAKAAAEIDARWKSLGAGATALGAAIGGAFSVTAITQFTRATIDQIDALNDAKDATGSTIENLSALEDVARRNGGTMDEVTGILVKFNGVLKEADGKNGVSQALKAIGLDAAALKQIDPAEALRQTAVALSEFADDGDKARVVQELFGKSVKDAAPFLKDLAEQGRLNATVTTEQADAAEKFNKQIFALQTNAGNASREIISGLVVAVNSFADALKGANQGQLELTASGSALRTFLEAITVLGANVAFVFKGVGNGLGGIAAQAAAIASGDFAGAGRIGDMMKSDAKKAREEIDAFSARILDRSPTSAGGGRGFVNPEVVRPTIGGVNFGGGGGGGGGTAARRTPTDYIGDAEAAFNKRIQDWQERNQEVLDKVGIQEFDDQLAVLESKRQMIEEEGLAIGEAIKSLYESTPEGAADRLRKTLEAIKAFEPQDGEQAAQKASAIKVLEEDLKRLEQTGVDVGATLKDALGDSLQDALSGNFDSIGERWKRLLSDMVAKALAADLMNAVTGQGSGGNTANLFAQFAAMFPGFASGGDHKGGFRVVGERGPELEFTGPSRIMNATQTQQVMRGGASKAPVYNINVAAGVGKAELYEAVQRGIQVSKADARQLLKTAGGY